MAIEILPHLDDAPPSVRKFIACIDDEHKMLLTLKRELYDGDWRPMLTDLRNRLEGRPYVVRLAGRIQDDLDRIEYMQTLERQYDVDLSDYLQATIDTEASA